MNMSTLELTHYMQNTIPNHIHAAVYAADNLKKCKYDIFAIIVNNEEAHLDGGHWTAFSKISDSNIVEFFDSFALPIHSYDSYFTKFVEQVGTQVTFSSIQIQENNTSTCGAFCLYYLLSRINGYTFNEIINSFDLNAIENNTTTVIEYMNCLNQNISKSGVNNNECSVNQICQSCCCEK